MSYCLCIEVQLMYH